MYFSGSGNLLCTVDLDFTKQHLIFYMITKVSNEGKTEVIERKIIDKRNKLTENVRDKAKNLTAIEDTYEFSKIARHEVRERRYLAFWDHTGRYFMIQGIRLQGFDKSAKSVNFYNIHGELVDKIENVPQLDKVLFRPRTEDILNANQVKQLKKDYKKKYGPMVDKEQAQEKKAQNDIIKDKRKKIRDDFLENFFIPLRKEYEEDIDEYKALWPLKESDFAEKKEETFNIFQYMEEISNRKLDIHQTD